MELYFHVNKFFFLKAFAVFLGLYALKVSLLINVSFKSKKNHENYLKMNKLKNKFSHPWFIFDIKIKDL